jgi:hypothetical protein
MGATLGNYRMFIAFVDSYCLTRFQQIDSTSATLTERLIAFAAVEGIFFRFVCLL